jgi:hypothetical protein
MAIQKEKVLANGVSGNYWVLHNVFVSPDYSDCRANAELYVSQAAFASGDTAVYEEDIILGNGMNPFSPQSLAKLMELELITLPGDFVSGTYVL